MEWNNKLPVFRQDLVELWRGDEEEYGRDGIEALRPLLPLCPLPPHVDKYKWHVVDVDGTFRDALRGLPTVQDVLVGGDVVRSRNALQFIEEVAHRITLESTKTLLYTFKYFLNRRFSSSLVSWYFPVGFFFTKNHVWRWYLNVNCRKHILIVLNLLAL